FFRRCSKDRRRLKPLVAGFRSRRIPGTDFLTDIAAEDVIANSRGEFLRNRSTKLDRQVGNAAPRIDGPTALARDNCLCWTRLNTARARPAAVRRRRSGSERERQQHFPEKKPRALRLIDQASVAANPSQACLFRETAFEQRSRVDTNA